VWGGRVAVCLEDLVAGLGSVTAAFRVGYGWLVRSMSRCECGARRFGNFAVRGGFGCQSESVRGVEWVWPIRAIIGVLEGGLVVDVRPRVQT